VVVCRQGECQEQLKAVVEEQMALSAQRGLGDDDDDDDGGDGKDGQGEEEEAKALGACGEAVGAEGQGGGQKSEGSAQLSAEGEPRSDLTVCVCVCVFETGAHLKRRRTVTTTRHACTIAHRTGASYDHA
jgi:hypothetical protein